jgi:hypothetical protein
VGIPAKRIVERYSTVRGHGRVKVVVEQREPRVVKLSAEAIEACRQYLAIPGSLSGWWEAHEVRVLCGWIIPTGFAICIPQCRLGLSVSPYDFGTGRAPSIKEIRALVQAMRHTTVPYPPTRDRMRITKAFIRASVLAHTGARMGEVALLSEAAP